MTEYRNLYIIYENWKGRKYYGKTKAITKRPVNLDIINNSNDKDQLQENLKNIKQKSINEIEEVVNILGYSMEDTTSKSIFELIEDLNKNKIDYE